MISQAISQLHFYSVAVWCGSEASDCNARMSCFIPNHTVHVLYLGMSVGQSPSTMADPGGAPSMRPPRSWFFRFDIQILWNIAASGVGAPPTSWAPPYGEILDPLLLNMYLTTAGTFSYSFLREYASLFASIAAIVFLLLTSDKKSSHWGQDFIWLHVMSLMKMSTGTTFL